MSTPESVTILTSEPGVLLAKTIGRDGTITAYDRARLFKMQTVPVADMAELARLLVYLASQPNRCAVRGEPIDPTSEHRRRRLLHPDPETGDPATLREVPRAWVALDMDAVPLPKHIAPADLHACAQVAVGALPESFHGAECIVFATASHGLKTGGRLRLWYGLDRPTTGAELGTWLADSPVDHAVFRPAQVIYTSAPMLAPGVADHLPRRFARLHGTPTVTVPDAAKLAPPARPERACAASGVVRGVYQPPPAGRLTRRRAETAINDGTARIAFAAEGDRHATLLRVACGLAHYVRAGLTSESLVRTVLTGALAGAGKDNPAPEAAAALAWAMAHAGVVA